MAIVLLVPNDIKYLFHLRLSNDITEAIAKTPANPAGNFPVEFSMGQVQSIIDALHPRDDEHLINRCNYALGMTAAPAAVAPSPPPATQEGRRITRENWVFEHP